MPRSPWQAMQACATSAPAGPGRDKLRSRSVLQATSVVGSALAALVGWRMVGDPGTMPTARQIAVHGSMPAPVSLHDRQHDEAEDDREAEDADDEEAGPAAPGPVEGFELGRLHAHPLPSTRCTMASGGLIQKNWAMG